jgi:hypothetical protein
MKMSASGKKVLYVRLDPDLLDSFDAVCKEMEIKRSLGVDLVFRVTNKALLADGFAIKAGHSPCQSNHLTDAEKSC